MSEYQISGGRSLILRQIGVYFLVLLKIMMHADF